MNNNVPIQVRELHNKYRESLVEKLTIAKDWQQKSLLGLPSHDELQVLSGWAHKLAGSAGMYEFDTLSSLARKVLERTERLALEFEEKNHDELELAKLQQDLLNLVDELQSLS